MASQRSKFLTLASATNALIGLSVLMFLLEISLGQNLESFLQVWAFVPRRFGAILAGDFSELSVLLPLTLLTSQFLHGGPLHLGGNMLFLWIFGTACERKLGALKLVLLFLGCGAFSTLLQWRLTADSFVPILGSGGAVMGLMGAYIIYYPSMLLICLLALIFALQTFVPSISWNPIGMDSSLINWIPLGSFAFGIFLGSIGKFLDSQKSLHR